MTAPEAHAALRRRERMALRSDHDRGGGQKHERRLADEGAPAGLAHPPPGCRLHPDSAVYQYGLSCNPLFKGA